MYIFYFYENMMLSFVGNRNSFSFKTLTVVFKNYTLIHFVIKRLLISINYRHGQSVINSRELVALKKTYLLGLSYARVNDTHYKSAEKRTTAADLYVLLGRVLFRVIVRYVQSFATR